jgi:DNA-binding HxlR family transcriptional regulator
MKDLISNINKVFESRIRLGIMSVLMVNETYDFNSLKETLNVTDGNLASHLKALEERGMIKVNKQLSGVNQIIYSATETRILELITFKSLENLIGG